VAALVEYYCPEEGISRQDTSSELSATSSCPTRGWNSIGAIGSGKLTWWTGNRAATCAWVWDNRSSLAHSWEETLEPGLYSTGRRCFARNTSPHPVVTLQGKNICAGPHRCLPSSLAAAPVLSSRSAQRRPAPTKLSRRSPLWSSRTIRRKTSREIS
jgi:hypothetical protein